MTIASNPSTDFLLMGDNTGIQFRDGKPNCLWNFTGEEVKVSCDGKDSAVLRSRQNGPTQLEDGGDLLAWLRSEKFDIVLIAEDALLSSGYDDMKHRIFILDPTTTNGIRALNPQRCESSILKGVTGLSFERAKWACATLWVQEWPHRSNSRPSGWAFPEKRQRQATGGPSALAGCWGTPPVLL